MITKDLIFLTAEMKRDETSNTHCDGQVILDKKLSFDSSVFSL